MQIKRMLLYFDLSLCSLYDLYLCNDTSNFCVSIHMNPVATHEFSVDFARELKGSIIQ